MRSTLLRRAWVALVSLVPVVAPVAIAQPPGPLDVAATQFPFPKTPYGLIPFAMNVQGSISCDNYHRVYTARCEGPGMIVKDQGGSCAFSPAVPVGIITHDRLLYIVCWSDDDIAQGLLHDLSINGTPVPSGGAGWQVYPTGIDSDSCATGPTAAVVAQQIWNATSTNAWQTPTVGPLNSTAPFPWGTVAGIAGTSRWTWWNNGLQPGLTAPFRPGFDHDEFLIFRAPIGLANFSIAGEVSCDNFHAVYTADVESPAAVVTAHGSGCSIATATAYNFTTQDRFLYIAAWSDDGIAQGLLHDLTVNGVPVSSGSNATWTVAGTKQDIDTCAGVPTVAQIYTAIQPGTHVFSQPTFGPNHGTVAQGPPWFLIWGAVAGIHPSARWTWHNPTAAAMPAPFQPGADHDEFLLFRLDLYACPIALASLASLAGAELTSDVDAVSVALGGAQHLHLDGGLASAGAPYLLLGSASGTDPATNVLGVDVPLAADPYFALTLGGVSGGAFRGFAGTLDAMGVAEAGILVAPGTPALAGIRLWHAYLLPTGGLASNPVLLRLDP